MLSLLGVMNALVAVAFILASRPDIHDLLVAFLVRTTSDMTWKKAAVIVAAAILAVLAAEFLPFDLALPMFIDAFGYIDIVAAVYFALANRQVRAWGRIAKDQLALAGHKLLAAGQRQGQFARRLRRVRRSRPRTPPRSSDDRDGMWVKPFGYAV
ncbi:MAG: hypothetical protein ACYDD1_18390 [Caulobacteraceae bacterium]